MSVKTSFSNLCVVLKEKLGNKVDKVVGKGLSANDFTTAYKTKLDGIATGATKITVDTTLSASSTNPVQNKAVNTAIINIKNDLINYYKKTETYSKTEIDTKISLIPKFSIKVVKTLPTTDISATTVYLKTSKTSLAGNLYDEYIYVDSKWELLGSQTVDLSGYVTTSSMNTALANKVDKVSGKGLSTNDYTTAEKNKLAGIATGANKTVVDSDISATSTNPIQNKAVGLKFQGVDSEISGINSVLKNKPNLADVYTRTDIDSKYFMTMLRGTELSENTDLNSITTSGVYYTGSRIVAMTCSNTPGYMLGNFRLEVFFSSGDNSSNTYLMQQLYQNGNGALYVWVRGMTTVGNWSPWHLLNGNDFTSYNYDFSDVTEKYIKVASCQMEPDPAYADHDMTFEIQRTFDRQANVYNRNGRLHCHVRFSENSNKPSNITVIWENVGTDVIQEKWFATYNTTTRTFDLWKKIESLYESYRVTLISSSQRGTRSTFDNLVTMYYLKETTDTYNPDDYSMIVTSTTCNSTAATKADIANIQKKVIDTGWITTGNLKYRKSGYIVALQGSVTPSGSTMSITLGILPNDCRPSQDISIAQEGTDAPSRQIIVQKGGSVVLLFSSNCTASHTYAYNGIFMI